MACFYSSGGLFKLVKLLLENFSFELDESLWTKGMWHSYGNWFDLWSNFDSSSIIGAWFIFFTPFTNLRIFESNLCSKLEDSYMIRTLSALSMKIFCSRFVYSLYFRIKVWELTSWVRKSGTNSWFNWGGLKRLLDSYVDRTLHLVTMMKLKEVPYPTLLWTETYPSIWSAMRLQIDKPKPVPKRF